MTMTVSVKNEDLKRVADVVEETYTIGAVTPGRVEKTSLQPGESRTYSIHAAKRLIIIEDPGR